MGFVFVLLKKKQLEIYCYHIKLYFNIFKMWTTFVSLKTFEICFYLKIWNKLKSSNPIAITIKANKIYYIILKENYKFVIILSRKVFIMFEHEFSSL